MPVTSPKAMAMTEGEDMTKPVGAPR
jgi:hypothetical protein